MKVLHEDTQFRMELDKDERIVMYQRCTKDEDVWHELGRLRQNTLEEFRNVLNTVSMKLIDTDTEVIE